MTNIFKRYAVRSMARNKARTFVTIIGMALSMALFTAVIEGAASGLVFFRQMTIEDDGSYHAVYRDVSADESQSFLQNDQVQSSATFNEVGYAKESNYPYIRILSGDPQTDLLKVKLASGTYPLTNGEILMPQNATDLNGSYYQLNQTISLDVGIPYKDGKRARLNDLYDFENKDTNELRDTVSKTYKIVGFYTTLPVESAAGFNDTAFTTDDTGDGIVDTYFTVNNIYKIKDAVQSAGEPDHMLVHQELLRYYSPRLAGLSSNAAVIIYGFAAVLIILVLVGSISMIANSFSISVSERMKEYGMLKSIGASRHQIRTSVLTEALLCSLYGIVPGMALGFGGLAVVIHLVSSRLTAAYSDSAARIHMVLYLPGLLAAVLICLLTALIAAWKPASKAMRIMPIESIRETNEIKLKSKQVKTSRFTWKLFGLEGALTAKNFQRSRSRFRSIIFSLSMSVILFISSVSLSSYMTKAINIEATQNPADISINANAKDNDSLDSIQYTQDLFTNLKNVSGLTNGTWIDAASADNISVPSAALTKDYCTYGTMDQCKGKEEQITSQSIVFMDDDSYRQMLKDNNVSDPDSYFDTAHPKGVVFNTEDARVANNRKANLPFMKKNAFPAAFTVTAYQRIDGEQYVSNCGEHNEYACYLKVGQPTDDLEDIDKNAHKVPLSEAAMTKQLLIGAAVTNTGMAYTTQPIVIYPSTAYATLKAMGIVYDSYYDGQIYFQTNHHEQAAEAMEKYIADNNYHYIYVNDNAENMEATRSILFTIRVFSTAFILLISLIAIANIFNTISTNMQVRKREFAMLRSIGMTSKGFKKMLLDECLTYGLRSLIIAMPLSILVTYIIYNILHMREEISFFIPVSAVIISIIAIFIVITLSILYGQHKLNKENLVEALRSETA